MKLRKRLLSIVFILLIMLLILSLYAFFTSQNKDNEVAATAEPTVTPTIEPTVEPTPEPTATIDVYDTNSILVCANKKHALPDGYEPSDLVTPDVVSTTNWQLRQEAATALEEMFAAAKNDGVTLVLGSAYRSYAYQEQLYNGYVASKGVEGADAISSRPGYSDHQTGLAVDISDAAGQYFLYQTFENTEEGIWLYENAYKYGWIMRYPKDKQDITGYAYEPWHFRYVGVDAATAIYSVSPQETYEEYFDVEGGDYE